MCGEASKIEAVCAACGAEECIGVTSMLDLLERLKELRWGMLECGLLVCPSCLTRIATRAARMANAGLN